MTQIQSYSDEKLISYVEKHAKDLPMVSDRWVACKKELECRGYIFWPYTGKVIRNASAARGCWCREFANIKIR